MRNFFQNRQSVVYWAGKTCNRREDFYHPVRIYEYFFFIFSWISFKVILGWKKSLILPPTKLKKKLSIQGLNFCPQLALSPTDTTLNWHFFHFRENLRIRRTFFYWLINLRSFKNEIRFEKCLSDIFYQNYSVDARKAVDFLFFRVIKWISSIDPFQILDSFGQKFCDFRCVQSNRPKIDSFQYFSLFRNFDWLLQKTCLIKPVLYRY